MIMTQMARRKEKIGKIEKSVKEAFRHLYEHIGNQGTFLVSVSLRR